MLDFSGKKAYLQKGVFGHNVECQLVSEVIELLVDKPEQDGPLPEDIVISMDDEELSSTSPSGVLLGVGGFFVTCITFLCPCWARRRVQETDSQDMISG